MGHNRVAVIDSCWPTEERTHIGLKQQEEDHDGEAQP
jgi:hypothetical protein